MFLYLREGERFTVSDLSLNYDPDLIGQPGYGDLLIADGDLVLTADVNPRGTDSVLQLVTQRIKFFLGEWFLDNSAGLPWFQQILVKNADQSTVDGLLRDCILGTPGVVALLAYTSSQKRALRQYSISFTILTATGASISASIPVSVVGGTGS